MKIIRHKLPIRATALVPVDIHVDRLTLQKTRWRGVAEDGAEFGFDLAAPLQHGDAVHATGEALYVIEQAPEPVLEVTDAFSGRETAVLAWSIGNLHQPAQFLAGCIRMPDDPALRALLDQLHLPYAATEAVFQPQAGAARPHRHSHHLVHTHPS